MENTNLFTKLANIKAELSQTKLTKSGYNSFTKFKYFELADFLPIIVQLCAKHGVFTYVSFNNELATLTATDGEKSISVSSPMVNAQLDKMPAIQALGATETYQRRYLYMAMFDISESDSMDAIIGQNSNQEQGVRQSQTQQRETVQLNYNGNLIPYEHVFNKQKNSWFWVISKEYEAAVQDLGCKKYISEQEMKGILGN